MIVSDERGVRSVVVHRSDEDEDHEGPSGDRESRDEVFHQYSPGSGRLSSWASMRWSQISSARVSRSRANSRSFGSREIPAKVWASLARQSSASASEDERLQSHIF